MNENEVMENVVEKAAEVVKPTVTGNNKIAKLIALGGAVVTGVIGAIVIGKKRKHRKAESSAEVEMAADDEVETEEYVEED